MASTIRNQLLGTAHIERGRLQIWGAVRNLVVYLALVLSALLAGHKEFALPLAVGALFASLADAGEDVGRRWRTMLWTTLWISVTTLLGSIGADFVVLSVLFSMLVALIAGMGGMLGPRAALVGVLALVTYTIFNGAPDSERTLVHNVLGIAIGGIAVTVVTIVPHLFDRVAWQTPGTPVDAIKARIGSQLTPSNDWVRHGVRLAIVIGIATLATDITTYPHDYWLPMTVAWVTKPDKNGTSSRIIARIAGTVVGVLVAAFLVNGLQLGSVEIAIAAGLGSALAVMFVNANYAVAVVGVTLLVVGLFTFDGDPIGQTIVLRIIMTVAAGLLSFLAFYIWPPAKGPEARS